MRSAEYPATTEGKMLGRSRCNPLVSSNSHITRQWTLSTDVIGKSTLINTLINDDRGAYAWRGASPLGNEIVVNRSSFLSIQFDNCKVFWLSHLLVMRLDDNSESYELTPLQNIAGITVHTSYSCILILLNVCFFSGNNVSESPADVRRRWRMISLWLTAIGICSVILVPSVYDMSSVKLTSIADETREVRYQSHGCKRLCFMDKQRVS